MRLLSSAYDFGIRQFDCAPLYGFGLSERVLGEALKNLGSDVSVTTKIGLYPPGRRSNSQTKVILRKSLGKIFRSLSEPEHDFSVRSASLSLDASLKSLKRERIEYLFLHEPWRGHLDSDALRLWIETQQLAGKVGKFGVCGDLSLVRDFLREEPDLGGVVQVGDSYNPFAGSVPISALKNHVQFAYGYFKGCRNNAEFMARLAYGLNRVPLGSVIFSTSRVERLKELLFAYELLDAGMAAGI